MKSNGTSRQKESPPAQNLASEPPRVALPGELYQRADQWWWRVKLPGKDKARARPLRPDGAKATAADRETAEKIAFATWEHAVREDATRQMKWESAEKIERLKAQFLDKVRHFTELVETANARIEVEMKARAEAEAKLAQILQAAGSKGKDAEWRADDARPPALPSAAQIREVDVAAHPVSNPQGAIISLPALTAGSGDAAPCDDREPQPEPSAIDGVIPTVLKPEPPLEAGACQCCGATGIAMVCLTRIDSGQSLCPRCLAAFRADVARIDSDEPD